MGKTVTLKAPDGVCSVSFAGQEYPVKAGSVTVPEEACKVLGYAVAAVEPEPVPIAKGTYRDMTKKAEK